MTKQYDTSINATRGAPRRRLAATFCSIAFVFNLLCGVGFSLAPAQASLTTRALQNGWNIVCSAGGPIVVAADGSRVPDGQTGALGFTGPRCLFCLPLMHGVALADAADVPTPAQALPPRRLLPPAALVVARFSSSQAWPRAPPLLSIG